MPPYAEARSCLCSSVWEDIVDLAIREGVELVAISGDLVDRSNHFYEAYGPLETGIRRLARARIQTVAVAGNHDFDVLPTLANDLDAQAFTLLGAGGTWGRRTFMRDGKAALHVDGWSFTQEHMPQCPLEGYADGRADGVPVLGLLHADLDQPQSRYGPVALADLQRRPVSLWLLGHIHKPALREANGAARVLYPGSPQAMDPGETGAHGPWIVDLTPGRPTPPRQMALSRVRYEQVDIDLDGAEDLETARADVVRQLKANLNRQLADSAGLKYVSCRLNITGRTPLDRALRQMCEEITEQLKLDLAGGSIACIDKINLRTRPPIDLPALAASKGPPAELARLLIALESGDEAASAIAREARRRWTDVWSARSYEAASDDAVPGEAEARQALIAEGYALLDQLLAPAGEGDSR
jgi:DNA repair exonuclease SbcCD nuclease subunit